MHWSIYASAPRYYELKLLRSLFYLYFFLFIFVLTQKRTKKVKAVKCYFK
ncbi:hypothetical protein SAMN05192553_11364 [Cyclobacterium xiamenense]|jgi:hypothetical protein|uniref:Uncharacterized protein n=1 Tax=Cyclobacterium xiamenense TaxID=1297121 RepID=A0A1H7BS60_9BACT|nr:hypothetical protein SAMN05192553_11364 [Cyclobacterium xiamenense]